MKAEETDSSMKVEETEQKTEGGKKGEQSMETTYAIVAKNIEKKYKNFKLDIPECRIPQGFATAIIGENGAGKSTFLNILAGICLDYKGDICYFNEPEYSVEDVKERLGYTGPGNYFLPHWNIKQVEEIGGILFENFSRDRFTQLCNELGIAQGDAKKKVSALSDGNRMKLVLASVLARNTDCLLMDEPASPLDPLMRDKLAELIREYLTQKDGERSVVFSTHNISDMENVTDYCIIMEQGKIVESGFVEDLKEKYILVKGDAKDAAAAKEICYSFSSNAYGFEGICLAEDVEKFAGMDISMETASLFQISVAVMKAHTTLKVA